MGYYKHTCINVNKSDCLTHHSIGFSLQTMKYGERLKKARTFADLTQKELVERMGGVVSQQNISLLESGDATGSEFTVQIATACGVRPEWLAMEQGEMADGMYVENEKIKRAVVLMQELPDYALDEAIKGIDSVAKLSRYSEAGKK